MHFKWHDNINVGGSNMGGRTDQLRKFWGQDYCPFHRPDITGQIYLVESSFRRQRCHWTGKKQTLNLKKNSSGRCHIGNLIHFVQWLAWIFHKRFCADITIFFAGDAWKWIYQMLSASCNLIHYVGDVGENWNLMSLCFFPSKVHTTNDQTMLIFEGNPTSNCIIWYCLPNCLIR